MVAYADPKDARGKEAKHRWYIKNKHRYLDYNAKTRGKVRDFLKRAKERPCADCKRTYPYYVMDFDHRPGTDKTYDLSKVARRGSMAVAKVEIAKCDVVCSNCHRERTHERATRA